MLPFSSEKIIPKFLQNILPSNVFYGYFLPLQSIVKKTNDYIHNIVKTCVIKLKGKSDNRTKYRQNGILCKYLRRVGRTLKQLELVLDKINTTSNDKNTKLKEQQRRKRRYKRFKKLLKKINILFPMENAINTMEDLPTAPPTRFVTWKLKKRLRTTRRKLTKSYRQENNRKGRNTNKKLSIQCVS